jgi:hypothetical protein
MLWRISADTHKQRIGNMLHQTDDVLQTESADRLRLGWAKPTSAGVPAGWPAPDPSLLEDGRPVVPVFPLDAVPQPWREWVSDTAGGAGAPVDYVAQAVLGAVAGLCGAGVRASVSPSWSEPLVLWQALVGAPSAGEEVRRLALGKTANAGQTELVLPRLWRRASCVRPIMTHCRRAGVRRNARKSPGRGTSGVAEIAENKFYVAR